MLTETEARRREQAAELDAEILAAISAGELSDFDGLARRIFAHQFEHCSVYRSFCQRRGATPDNVTEWRHIPAVPTAALKFAELRAFPAERTTAEFQTSGTTDGRPGRHFFETTQLYDAAAVAHFRQSVPLPFQTQWLSLTPSPAHAPHSSLAHMIAVLMRRWDPPRPDRLRQRFFPPSSWVEFTAELARLSAEPVCLWTTAFALIGWHDQTPTGRFPLPAGSVVISTGGFKGRSRRVEPAEFADIVARRFGLGPDQLRTEYGMTELSSQYYDCVGSEPRALIPPAWMRPMVVDPVTLTELPAGAVGILRHVDLANRGSCVAIQTEDTGRVVPGGIQLLGRLTDAEPRGCSLAVEQLLSGA